MVAKKPKPAPEVSPRVLGERAGYTERQVQKWCRMGLPCRKVPNGKRTDTLIDLAAGLAWIKANATGIPGAHGGKRGGAGRKGAKPEAQGTRHKALVSEPDAPCPVPGAPPAPRRLTPPRTLEAASFRITAGGGSGVVEPDPEDEQPYVPPSPTALRKLTAIEVKQHLDIEKILSERVSRGEKEGTLISVEDARKEWVDACTVTARTLGNLRDTLSGAIVTDLGLSSDKKPRLRQIIERELVRVLAAMRTTTFGPAKENLDAIG